METAKANPFEIRDFKYFYPERPRLLHLNQSLFEDLSNNPNWIAEPKYNGSRLQLHHLPNGVWEFWNRHQQPMSYRPNVDIMRTLAGLRLNGYWLFDGELRHAKVRGISHRIMLYDVFISGGILLLDMPFSQRRAILETVLHYCGPSDETMDSPQQFDRNFRDAFETYRTDPEIEGLVIKNLEGRLNLGRNRGVDSSWMWKVRRASNVVRF